RAGNGLAAERGGVDPLADSLQALLVELPERGLTTTEPRLGEEATVGLLVLAQVTRELFLRQKRTPDGFEPDQAIQHQRVVTLQAPADRVAIEAREAQHLMDEREVVLL